ncbi:MAG TPA: type II toxin-antitoxin system VapC family toxin [Candidatus Kapabacteria bacterium]|nr:type II toxin-antitoxin system VapC family toxin [Candidatus Kapabacteria bacterium]
MLILDTHIWIWLVSGDEKIKKAGFLEAINKASQKNLIKIPAICAWEVSMLVAKKRIQLLGNTLDWLNKALLAPGISLFPLSSTVAYESANLPGGFHGDPADRMIVASARILNGTLVTLDRKILKYAEAGYVNVIIPQIPDEPKDK